MKYIRIGGLRPLPDYAAALSLVCGPSIDRFRRERHLRLEIDQDQSVIGW
jgi:hypothetical protein